MNEQQLNFRAYKVTNDDELNKLQKEYYQNHSSFFEYMAWAINSNFVEIANKVIVDKKGTWNSPIYCLISEHPSNIGAKELVRKANTFFKKEQEKTDFDIISLCAGMENDRLILKSLLRVYSNLPDVKKLFKAIGSDIIKKESKATITSGNLCIPDAIANFKITPEQKKEHDKAYAEQLKVFNNSTSEKPFLNQIERYIPKKIVDPTDFATLIYDIKTKDMNISTITQYEQFVNVFNKIMTYVSGVEYYHYVTTICEKDNYNAFMSFIEEYIRKNFIDTQMLAAEDLHIMLNKVYTALFEFYVLQDLIEDPLVTDIKVTDYNTIRVRIKGKAYLSNITFVDENDYMRFLNGICLKNQIRQDVPYVRFSDKTNKDYRLRMTITADYINSNEAPSLHIRKQPNKKLMAKELMEAGMFDEKIRDYVLDRARNGSVIIAGSPGSGKTYFLNWLLEDAYEESAEILVIQETDELFAYRKGVMLQHVVLYPPKGQYPIDLEGLGQNALVAGANVFIIGEAKGPEFCSAMTLAASGCRTALTLHSESAEQVSDKMVDLALKGYYDNPNQVKRMLTCFQTVVYLENFKIKEIVEVTGYDDDAKKLLQKCVYRMEDSNGL